MIIECDGCGNLLYLQGSHDPEEVAPCPLCGCLNRLGLEPDQQMRGRIVLKSPLMDMSRNSLEEGRISLPGLPQKVQEALLWLQENRWSFGFMLEQEKDEDEDEDEDEEASP